MRVSRNVRILTWISLVQGIGAILHGEAFSQSWQALPNSPRPQFRLDDVFFINPLVGWACGGARDEASGGEIHRTTDGGASWHTYRDSSSYFRSITFVNAQKGWAGTLGGKWPLRATIDGGAMWQYVDRITGPWPVGICGLSAVDENVIYGCGRYNGPPIMIKTVDGGSSWTSIELSSLASWLIDCRFWSPDSGIVVGKAPSDGARILSTWDGGRTWQVRYSSLRSDESCWKITFPTRLVGYVSIQGFGVNPSPCVKTTDGGLTWSETHPPFEPYGNDQQGIGFATETLGWVGGYMSAPFRTTDGGMTWQRDPFGGAINRFRFLSPELGYAVGRRVYKYSRQTPVEGNTMSKIKSKYR